MYTMSAEDERVYTLLVEKCMDIYKNSPKTNVSEIAIELMSMKEVPIHYPFHHFIVPASFLVATAVAKEDPEDWVQKMLEMTAERAKMVPGGACGNLGACGAGVGAGIFMSVYTGTNPMSGKTWSWANEITGKCLQAIAKVAGPRCCKRTAFMVIEEAVPYINEKLNTNLEFNAEQKCTFHEQNRECKRKNCPFYPE